eukprot:Clim_evm34s198 gene=Clim_evmTU34s198
MLASRFSLRAVAATTVRRALFTAPKSIAVPFVRRAYASDSLILDDFYDKSTGIYKSRMAPLDIPTDKPFNKFMMEAIDQYPPEQVTMVDYGAGGRKVTYGELKGMINAIAGALTVRGMGKGDTFCLWLPNTAAYPALYLGACEVGTTITTANPTYHAHEIEFQLNDSGATLLTTIPLLLDLAIEAVHATADHVKEIIVLSADGKVPEEYLEGGAKYQNKIKLTSFMEFMASGHGQSYSSPLIDPMNDLVCLPYSSGTTGRPKGVMLTHYNVVANVMQYAAAMDPHMAPNEDSVLGLMPFFHIYGMVVIMWHAIYRGCKMPIMPKFDPVQFFEIIQNEKLTMVHIAPPIALMMASHPIVDKFDLSSVKYVMSAAAPLGLATQEAVAKRTGISVGQGYGMTELSPVAHLNPCTAIRPGSCGVAVPNIEMIILDVESGEPLPPGDGRRGELLIRGPNVMKGYLGRDDATKETIRDDGFMHTGDIVEIDKDGYMFVVDRLKELIKYKGFQVPPAELEDELLTHPQIVAAAVVGKPHGDFGELPVGYVKLAEGAKVSEDEVKGYIAERVAPHKQLRGGVRFVDEIPASASGKVLRRVLRDELKKEAEAEGY